MTAALLGAALSMVLRGATRKKVAFRENHVSTSTAQQSVLHFQQRSCSNSNSNSRLGIGQFREQRVVTAANRQHDDRDSEHP